MQTWTLEDLQKHLDQGDKFFLKIWRNDCAPCKASIPVVDKLEAEYPQMIFAQISVDDHPDIVSIAGLRGVPTFLAFANKVKQGASIGFQGAAPLRALIDTALEEET